MINLKFYLVAHEECRDMVFDKITPEEISKVCCYAVNQKRPKKITNKISCINEWELPWHDSVYQDLQYYEYGFLAHLYKNPQLAENLTHIGFVHNDIVFRVNSINDVISDLEKNPDQIFYNGWINDKRSFYLTKEQLYKVCEYLSYKLKIFVNVEQIWNVGWIACMCVAPVNVFMKFGKFLYENHEDIEDIIATNRWGIHQLGRHRPCGLIGMMWGYYLVSLNMRLSRMNILHDGTLYQHSAWGDDLKNFSIKK